MVTNRIIFFATSVQPNPEEIDYWVDLSDNPYGGSIKYFNFYCYVIRSNNISREPNG